MGFPKAVDLQNVLYRCAITAGNLIDGLAATYPMMDNLALSWPCG
jgi:hypothetical protein